MHPLFGDAKRSSEQMNLAGFITSAHEDYRSFEWGVEIELELLGECSAVWGAVSTRCGLAAVSADVALGGRHQGLDRGAVVALPDFGLPQTVKAFNGVLEARLSRRGEHRDDFQCQTQAADAPDRVGELGGPLEDRIVVQPGISGPPLFGTGEGRVG